MRSLRCEKKKVEKNFLHRKKDREMVIGYTFRVGYIYRADCKNVVYDIVKNVFIQIKNVKTG